MNIISKRSYFEELIFLLNSNNFDFYIIILNEIWLCIVLCYTYRVYYQCIDEEQYVLSTKLLTRQVKTLFQHNYQLYRLIIKLNPHRISGKNNLLDFHNLVLEPVIHFVLKIKIKYIGLFFEPMNIYFTNLSISSCIFYITCIVHHHFQNHPQYRQEPLTIYSLLK